MHPDIFKRVWNWSCVWHHLRSVFVISVEICVVIHGTLVSFFMNFRHITLDKTSQFLSSPTPLMCHSVAHFSRTMCEECCQKCGWNHTLQASFFKKINSLCQQNLLKTHFFLDDLTVVFTGWQFAQTSFYPLIYMIWKGVHHKHVKRLCW